MEEFDNKKENEIENDNLSNVGKKWSNNEDKLLIEEVNNKQSYDDIALNHKRTKLAIVLRVISHIIYPKYFNNNNDNDNNNNNNNNNNDDDNNNKIDNISKEYNIDIELLKKNINKLIQKEEPKEKRGIKGINEQILEQLILLNKKMDKLLLK
jgi:hypothetical protein